MARGVDAGNESERRALMARPQPMTARQFGDAMAAIGAVLDADTRLLMVQMTWRMVSYPDRRAGVLAPAEPFRPRDLKLPKPHECRVPPRPRRKGDKRRV